MDTWHRHFDPRLFAVINEYPTYLKLHSIDDQEAVATTAPVSNFDLDRFCNSFSQATGYLLDYGEDLYAGTGCFWSIEVASYDPMETIQFAMSKLEHLYAAEEAGQVIDRLAAEDLAGECANLIDDLHRTERALREREAELATSVPMTVGMEEQPEKLANRLTAILEGGCRAVGCQAASVYMLDDETRFLKVRVSWGLPNNRYTDPPRTLRGSKGDLEALAGHAVVLEKLVDLPNWNAPEDYASAVCVPVSTADMPLGTMWVFADEERGFSDNDVNLLEIIAGRIAGELEREVLLCQSRQQRGNDFLEDAIAAQKARLPQASLQLDHWEFAGTTGYVNSLCNDDYYWYQRADGKMLATVHTFEEEGLASTWNAAMLAGTVRAQSEAKDAADVLTAANRTLWTNSSGDQSASLAAVLVDPATNEIALASAGRIEGFVIRHHGWETVDVPANMVGSDQAIDLASFGCTLEEEDILLMIAGNPRRRPSPAAESTIDGQFFAETLLHHNHLPAAEMVGLLRDLWCSEDAIWRDPPAMLVIRRRT